tara:strand:+ start:83 stop:598 length:516 start_codon:yes stop_codon:yes gene_type:complete
MSGKSKTIENHSKFLSHLDESQSSVWLVAQMLSSRGYDVRIPPTVKAKQKSDWKSCADGGDLFISQRVEVKRLGVNFSSRDDWPFGSKFIVCAKHSFDLATPKPFAYVILSNDTRFASCVFASDSTNWIVERRTDSRYSDVSQDFYFSKLDSVRFFEMPSNAQNSTKEDAE